MSILQPSRRAYKDFIRAVIANGEWLGLPRRLLRALGPSGAVLTVHIANVAQASADDGGWIFATPRFIEHGTGITAERQPRVLARLEKRGIVEVQFRGRQRYLRADLTKLREACR